MIASSVLIKLALSPIKKDTTTKKIANDIMINGILLGCHQGLKFNDLNYIFKTFKEFVKIKKL